MTNKDVFRDIVLPSAGLRDKPNYTITEVALMFGVSTRTIYVYLKQGIMPFTVYRFGKTPRVYREELYKFFNNSSITMLEESSGAA